MRYGEPPKVVLQPQQRYEAEAWRMQDPCVRDSLPRCLTGSMAADEPDARERSRLFGLLGLINYKILSGNKVYIEVGGIVYRTIYGGYWRSVFTGVEHFLLRCQAVSGGVWNEECGTAGLIDLPISHSQEGWTAQGHSLMFMLNRE